MRGERKQGRLSNAGGRKSSRGERRLFLGLLLLALFLLFALSFLTYEAAPHQGAPAIGSSTVPGADEALSSPSSRTPSSWPARLLDKLPPNAAGPFGIWCVELSRLVFGPVLAWVFRVLCGDSRPTVSPDWSLPRAYRVLWVERWPQTPERMVLRSPSLSRALW